MYDQSNVVLFFVDTLLVCVTYWKYLLTLTTVVIKTCFYNLWAFFLKSKRFGIIICSAIQSQI